MSIQELQKNWDEFGKTDPLWAILTLPDKKGQKWEKDEFFATGKQEIEGVMRSLSTLGIQLKDKKALDFGCGVGRLTQALGNYFEEVHGVDIAPSMIDLANKYNTQPDQCFYHLNSQDNLEIFAEGTFDFIYTNITLQHMKPQYSRKYLNEFLRLVSPQGILVFQLPSERTNKLKRIIHNLINTTQSSSFLYSLYFQLKFGTKAEMDMYGIPREEVIKLIENSGGKILEAKRITHNLEWTNYRYFCSKS